MQHQPGFLESVQEALQHIKEVSAQEVHQLLSDKADFVLIDVREDHEWEQGHLPEALHLSKGTIERDIEGEIPEHDTKLVLYCGGGYRSAIATKSIQDMGYSNAYSMAGGVRAWLEAGFKVGAS